MAWAGHWYDFLHIPYCAAKGQDAKHDRLGMHFCRVVPDWQKLQPCLAEPEAVAAEPEAVAAEPEAVAAEPDEATWTGDVNEPGTAWTGDVNEPDEATWTGDGNRGNSSGNVGAQPRNGLEPKCISLCTSFFRWKQAKWSQDRKAWQKFEQNVMALYYSRPNITRQVDNLTWR